MAIAVAMLAVMTAADVQDCSTVAFVTRSATSSADSDAITAVVVQLLLPAAVATAAVASL